MDKIETYPEMNEQIVKLLQMGGSDTDMYAAQYIGELQTEIEQLRAGIDIAYSEARGATREACAVLCEKWAHNYRTDTGYFALCIQMADYIRSGDNAWKFQEVLD